MSTIYNLEHAAPLCRRCKTNMEWHSTQQVQEPKEAVVDVYCCASCGKMEAVCIQVQEVA